MIKNFLFTILFIIIALNLYAVDPEMVMVSGLDFYPRGTILRIALCDNAGNPVGHGSGVVANGRVNFAIAPIGFLPTSGGYLIPEGHYSIYIVSATYDADMLIYAPTASSRQQITKLYEDAIEAAENGQPFSMRELFPSLPTYNFNKRVTTLTAADFIRLE